MILVRQRASAVLYEFVRSISREGVFLLPANVCPIVPIVFMKAGRRFEFIDIDADNLGMSQDSALDRIKRSQTQIAGLLYVRPFGAMQDIAPFFTALKADGLIIIDDRCLVAPAVSLQPLEDADLVLYSTGYAKYVDLGFGGYGFLKDPLERVSMGEERYEPDDLASLTHDYKEAIQHAKEFDYRDSDWLDPGFLEMSTEAYWSRVGAELHRMTRHKRLLNDIYASHIPIENQLPGEFQLWRFNVVVPKRDKLLRQIEEGGLFASSHYAPLNGIFGPGEGCNAKRLHDRIINLFNDRYFDEERAFKVAELARKHAIQYA